MALSKDEQEQLDALTRKAAESEDDDFDIEIWDENGAGAKVPYRKGKTWLQRFGIDVEPASEGTEDTETETGKNAPKTKKANASVKPIGVSQRYFGGNKAS